MKELIDGMERRVQFSNPPRRIISLCPSITETLFELGLEDRIVGRTSYCIHPEEKVKGATVIGGTKQVDFHLIRDLQPDLIITNKEETPKEVAEVLMEEFPLFIFDVQKYNHALKMIEMLGEITNRKEVAKKMVSSIEEEFAFMPGVENNRVAYLIWRKPYMAAGQNTFINSMLERCGFKNVLLHRNERYPAVTVEELRQLKVDYVFLSSEPFPFSEEHKEELQVGLPDVNIVLVDGQSFSWYGSKMEKAGRYFRSMIETLKRADLL
jgi:iron complex transport system substrate-binding protein